MLIEPFSFLIHGVPMYKEAGLLTRVSPGLTLFVVTVLVRLTEPLGTEIKHTPPQRILRQLLWEG
jgi:hypothetical protein